MTCDDCKRKEATVFFKAVVNSKMTEMHLCESCAVKKGIDISAGQDLLSITGVFGNLSELAKEFLPRERKTLCCSSCGLKYSIFKETGRLGCPDCYKSFETQLTQLLTRIHGCAVHTGKKYAAGHKASRPIPEQAVQGSAGTLGGPEAVVPGATRGRGSRDAEQPRQSAGGSRDAEQENRIKELRSELKSAVAGEDYEAAAGLRDTIKEMENPRGGSSEKK
ncbi:MAG: UvrB/UvrC motif-containing protein [bacterium]